MTGAGTTITVGGMPGTGTSTLSQRLAQRLDLPYVYAGAIFRDEAAIRGMTVEEFNDLSQRDDAIDRLLDQRQLERLETGGLVLEGRMSGWLAHEHDVAAFKLWIVCDEEVRHQRLSDRDGGPVAEVRARTRAREQSELDRFERYYGADILDLSLYDLVLDSTDQGPDELVQTVVATLGS